MDFVNDYKEGKRRTGFFFAEWERKLIAKSLKPNIPKLEKKIERLKNHPKNEGQSTFLIKIDELRNEIWAINEMIRAME